MIRLVCIVELEDAQTLPEAQAMLDAFREAVQPSSNYNVTIYRATEREADTAVYLPEGEWEP